MLEELSGPQADSVWQWFVDRYRPMIQRLLWLHLDASRIDRALDEFWGYLYGSKVFESARRSRRFRCFLTGVVRNYARSWRRDDRGLGSAREVEVGQDAAAAGHALEDEEVRIWARHLVQLGLRSLADKHPDNAQALRWFYGISGEDSSDDEPQSATEIAGRLDRKVNAIHQILHRGRARLRAHIEAELRETVSDAGDLGDELSLVLSTVRREVPGLLA